jgi:ribose 5-phosphate isomerase A
MGKYKQEAAQEAFKLVHTGQVIGLGAGSTIAYLVALLSADSALVKTLTLCSPAMDTLQLLAKYGLQATPLENVQRLDIYFDGCDQFDTQLNALKSGGGIHTREKIFAAASNLFVLLGDSGKRVPVLDLTYPFTLEVIPSALPTVIAKIKNEFNCRTLNVRDQFILSDEVSNSNNLLDIHFEALRDLSALNHIKMLPGVVDHSLFYGIANMAIISGPLGTEIIKPL